MSVAAADSGGRRGHRGRESGSSSDAVSATPARPKRPRPETLGSPPRAMKRELIRRSRDQAAVSERTNIPEITAPDSSESDEALVNVLTDTEADSPRASGRRSGPSKKRAAKPGSLPNILSGVASPAIEQLATPISPDSDSGHGLGTRGSQLWLQPDLQARSGGSSGLRRRTENMQAYRPGSILSLRMQNFQVCVDVTYGMGPALNMIIAPNGSGKSTVVAAIYLLFGGKMGTGQNRRSLSSYIRQGQSQARIEAVLKGRDGLPDPRIVMEIVGDKAKYQINGYDATVEERDGLAREFSIQVNNLCQFLPQDRVGMFSTETPQQRLRSLEESVGSASMLQDHDELIKLGPQLLASSESTDTLRVRISELERKIAEYTEILASLEHRRESEEELKRLQVMKPLVKFIVLRAESGALERKLKELVKQEKEAARILQSLTTEADRREATNKRLEVDLRKVERELDNSQRENDAMVTRLEEARASLEKALLKHKEVTVEREGWNVQFAEAQEKLADAKAESETIQQRVASPEEVEGLRQQHLQAEARLTAIEDERDSVRGQISQQQRLLPKLTQTLMRLQSDLQKVSAPRQRLSKGRFAGFEADKILATIEQTSAVANQREQAGLMRGKFEKPLLLTGSLAHLSRDLARLVAMAIPEDATKQFVCTDYDDWSNITRELDRLGQRIQIADVSRVSHSSFKRPLTTEQLHQRGFAGWAVDLIEAPDAVKLMLCARYRLHLVPVAERQLKAADEAWLLEYDDIMKYVDPNGFVHKKRSKYGSRGVTTNTSRVTEKKFLGTLSQPSVESATASLRSELAAKGVELEAARRQIANDEERQAQFVERVRAARNEAELAARPYRDMRRALSDYERQQRIVRDLEKNIELLQKKRDGFAKQVESCAHGIQIAVDALEADGAAAAVVKRVDQMERLRFLRLHILTNDDAVVRLRAEVDGQLSPLREQVEASHIALQAKTDNLRRFQQEELGPIKRKLGVQEYRRAMTEAKQLDHDEIERKIVEIEARLALSESGHNIAETQQLLDRASAELSIKQAEEQSGSMTLASLQERITELRGRWTAEVDRIVGTVSTRFSEMFASLGYQGSVGVIRPEPARGDDALGQSYADWGLDIRVSFRIAEPPQSLSGQRQSGGERAVSTAIFLLSLQGLTAAPFSVVDEINQGMDKFNETNVHKFIVERSCGSRATQYFLITPKLLPDLQYHASMRVHAIYGGPRVTRSKIDYDKFREWLAAS